MKDKINNEPTKVNFNVESKEEKKSGFNIAIGIGLLILSAFLIGVFLIIFSIRNVIRDRNYSKDYVEVVSYMQGKVLAPNTSEGKTYYLVYQYVVDGNAYLMQTNYSTSVIPEIGSEKIVKYDKNDPGEAIFKSDNKEILTFIVGFMFVVIPLIFIFLFIPKLSKINDFLAPLFITILGFLIYHIMVMDLNSYSPITLFKHNGLLGLIPILFIIVGLYTLYVLIFGKKKKVSDDNFEDYEKFDE